MTVHIVESGRPICGQELTEADEWVGISPAEAASSDCLPCFERHMQRTTLDMELETMSVIRRYNEALLDLAATLLRENAVLKGRLRRLEATEA